MKMCDASSSSLFVLTVVSSFIFLSMVLLTVDTTSSFLFFVSSWNGVNDSSIKKTTLKAKPMAVNFVGIEGEDILSLPSVSSSSSSSSSSFSFINTSHADLRILPKVSKINESSTTLSLEKVIFQSGNIQLSKRYERQKDELSGDRYEATYSNLQRIEAGLARAREAIKNATSSSNQSRRIEDVEYVPYGPIYRNPNTFHRSYLEMEKLFKIFVYKEGEIPLFHNGPCRSIYSSEGRFIHAMEMENKFRTTDPDQAHVYFLPFSVTMMVRFVYVHDSRDFGPVKRMVSDYINVLAARYPYWNRSLGADHVMLSCHDWGPETSSSVPHLYHNSIRVLCNANTSEGFNPSKDATLPEINLITEETATISGGLSPSRRPILAFFSGGRHGYIRQVLINYWRNKDPNIFIDEYLPKKISYFDMMRKSKYCVCPSGYEVASPRIVEAIYAECVPVIMSDHYVLPFSDVLNWETFSVQVPPSEIPNLKRILSSISSRQYIRMQRRLKQVQKHFKINSPPKSVFWWYGRMGWYEVQGGMEE